MKTRRAAPHSVWADDVNVWRETKLRRQREYNSLKQLRDAERRDIQAEERAESRDTNSST